MSKNTALVCCFAIFATLMVLAGLQDSKRFTDPRVTALQYCAQLGTSDRHACFGAVEATFKGYDE